MMKRNDYRRGYDAAYEEIRAAIRDKSHPNVSVCPCPACEIIAELLQRIADTISTYLTEGEQELFQRLMQVVEDRQDIGNWPSLIVEGELSLWLDQKAIPE